MFMKNTQRGESGLLEPVMSGKWQNFRKPTSKKK